MKNKTRVIFRVDKAGDFKGSVTAIFVDEQATIKPDSRVCYAHIGQHGSCDIGWIKLDTRPAKPSEYRDLKRELESIGYSLEILKTMRGVQ